MRYGRVGQPRHVSKTSVSGNVQAPRRCRMSRRGMEFIVKTHFATCSRFLVRSSGRHVGEWFFVSFLGGASCLLRGPAEPRGFSPSRYRWDERIVWLGLMRLGSVQEVIGICRGLSRVCVGSAISSVVCAVWLSVCLSVCRGSGLFRIEGRREWRWRQEGRAGYSCR